MATEKRLIDANALLELLKKFEPTIQGKLDLQGMIEHAQWATVCGAIVDAPTVDAVELPKGKPGDYLEWDNGTGFRQIYHIHAVIICDDCMRYDIEICTPVVNHPAIVRILSREQAEKKWHERCAREVTQEEPTLTAECGERKDDGGIIYGNSDVSAGSAESAGS